MIGIFDSGLGGLTVVKELFKQLPDYQITYFGDTARTPYGNKSKETIIKYAVQDTNFLLQAGVRLIIIACNSASAVAADELKKKFPDIPIFEVITPAVKKAVEVTKNKNIGVIGTRATIASHIYENKIKDIKNGFKIFSQPCPLFVPLVEEGWMAKSVTKNIANTYLRPLKLKQIDALILGCTHYPLLKNIIQAKIGQRVTLVDPAEQTTRQIKQYLTDNPEIEKALAHNSNHQFYFSDLAPHLTNIMDKWLENKIKPQLHSIE